MKHGNIFLTEAEYKNYFETIAEPGYYTSVKENECVFDYLEELMHIYSDNTIAINYDWNYNNTAKSCHINVIFPDKNANYENPLLIVFTGSKVLSGGKYGTILFDTHFLKGISLFLNFYTYYPYLNGESITSSTNSLSSTISSVSVFETAIYNKIYSGYYEFNSERQYYLPRIPHILSLKRESKTDISKIEIRILSKAYSGDNINAYKTSTISTYNFVKVN